MHNLIWFRNDLRIYDNPALCSALSEGSVVAVYLLTQKQWDKHSVSQAKRSLIINQLSALAEGLSALNVPLKIIDCGDFSGCAGVLSELACELGAQRVYFNHEYEVNEQSCAKDIEEKLTSLDVTLKGYHDACMVRPGRIRTLQGECYKVFSAFKRAFVEKYNIESRPILNRPVAQENTGIAADLNALECVETDPNWNIRWPAGEEEAHDRLNRFMEGKVRDYDVMRDIPSVDGTSELSPYLAIGALTTTQCMQAALSLTEGHLDSGNNGILVWINELIWREFYRHLLAEYPRLCKFEPFKRDTDRLPWKHDEKLFKTWVEGKTGYPIVDAAMRQLSETGWMHNRLRMITAMFLTKHLFIDWRWGEKYFMEQLVDGDLASNNGGWQWSASTGVDAVPYFRIFNPTRQSQRFDAKGDFIRRYVPELAALDDKSIHQPSAQQAQIAGYPLPVVEHAKAVAQTKLWFKQLAEPAADLFGNEELRFA